MTLFGGVEQLFADASKSDYVVGGYVVHTSDELTGVLQAAQTLRAPVCVYVSADKRNLLKYAQSEISMLSEPIVLYASNVRALQDVVEIWEQGVRAFLLSQPDKDSLAFIKQKGGWCDVSSEDSSSTTTQGVVVRPGIQQGAFTGSAYISEDEITNLIRLHKHAVVSLIGLEKMSERDLGQIALLSISQIISDVAALQLPFAGEQLRNSLLSPEAALAFHKVVENLRSIGAEETATIYNYDLPARRSAGVE